MTHGDKQLLQIEKTKLIEQLISKGWTINNDKTHGPDTITNFLEINWSLEGRLAPQTAIGKVNAFKNPRNKTEAQHLIGVLRYDP